MNNPIVILGSSRSLGYTYQAVQKIIEGRDVPLVDLRALNITPYDYDHTNQGDDYLPLMKRLMNYSLLILATPVYWNTMSATMKIFVDRLNDLLSLHQDIGQCLKGKKVFVIASLYHSPPKGFQEPFQEVCRYMEMIYEGCSFISNTEPFEKEVRKAKRIIFGETYSPVH